MLITKFNKMIRNKTLWWFFAIIVSVSFIWAYSDYEQSGGGCSGKLPDAVGKLYEKEISARELDRAMFNSMRLRNFNTQSAENKKIIRHEAWKRLAALQMAEKLGISATINELTSAIGRDPTFQENGSFSKDRYRTIIESQMQVPVQQFEDFLREEIILQKLGSTLESCVWTSPEELNQRLTRITDQITIQYASFNLETNAPSITVSKDEVRKYFETNIEDFRVPDRINVKYIKIPISDYLAKVNVADKEAKQYYTNNMDRFTSSDTNNPAAKPFEEVKEEIVTELKQKKAMTEATDSAARFVAMLIPDQKGKAPTFNDAAKKKGYSILTSDFFSLREDVPNMKVDRDFNKAAFDLDPTDPERYFSDPISSDDAVYVLATGDKEKNHLPEFSSVEEKATAMAKKEASVKAFEKKCKEARESAAKAVKEGQKFEDAVKKFGATVSTNMSFSAYEAASNPFEYLDIILPKVMQMSKGELSETLDTDNGMIIVHVADKKSGLSSTAEAIRPEMMNAIDRSLTMAVYDDWKEYNLIKAGFVDKFPSSASSEDDDPAAEKDTSIEK
ncbi:MAG: hypothetical protein A2283_07670 [Lentisphaerae bacterium RIFOXYA12_FULL_48_11]|nr:MAG: hypothetical protein A2283_07670 [Lentisphaerae bacterium RIFOXYA12_FULL_48_11]